MGRWSLRAVWSSCLIGLLWCGMFSLCAAGVLKVFSGFWDGLPATISLGIVELFFVAALYWVRHERLRYTFTFAVFAMLAAVSAYRTLTNAASCGCLGFISVPPLSMFTFDLLVASAALAMLMRRRQGNTGAHDHVGLYGYGRCSAVLVVACVACFAIASGTTHLKKQADTSLVVLGSRANDIGDAFVIDLMHGDWWITILRQSCPTCKELLANGRLGYEPVLIAMFVDDVVAFYAEDTPDSTELIVSPILTSAGTVNAVTTPGSVRLRDGKMIEFRPLDNRKGV